MDIKLICCIGLDYDLNLVPHFVNHYSRYNIDSFHFILNKKNKFNTTDYLKYFTDLDSIRVKFEDWVGEFNSIDKIYKFNNIIENSTESHILLADVDEFQNHPGKINKDYVWGNLVDRVNKYSLSKKVTKKELDKQFPSKTKISNWTNTIKPCVFPSSERLLTSHLITKQYNNESTIEVNHYRWTDTRLRKAEDRHRIYKKLNEDGKRWPPGQKINAEESLHVISKLKPKSKI